MPRRLVAIGGVLVLAMIGLLVASKFAKAPSRLIGTDAGQTASSSKQDDGDGKVAERPDRTSDPGDGDSGAGETSDASHASSPPGLLILHATIGRQSASLDFIRRRPGPWRKAPARPRSGAFPVLVRLLGESGEEQARVLVHVEGLIPEGTPAEALQNGELIIGDQAFSAAIPTLIKLPDLPPPLSLRLETLEGRRLGAARLTKDGLARD